MTKKDLKFLSFDALQTVDWLGLFLQKLLGNSSAVEELLGDTYHSLVNRCLDCLSDYTLCHCDEPEVIERGESYDEMKDRKMLEEE